MAPKHMLLILSLLLSCAGQERAPAAPVSSPSSAASLAADQQASPPGKPVSQERAEFYAQAFPEAAGFLEKEIPSELIRAMNRGNNSFVAAQNAAGRTVGFLRDLEVKVTLSDACECDPLRVTLAFDPDYSLRTLLVPAPLKKLDHEPMSAAEVQQLIAIAKNPAAKLVALRHSEDLVDATSGATKIAFVDAVVEEAALSTHRVVGLVAHTREILSGAQVALESKRLRELIASTEEDVSRAKALAGFLAAAESPEAREQAYRLMAQAYVSGLSGGQAADEAVEESLLGTQLQPKVRAREAAHGCYAMVQDSLRLEFVAECLALLRQVGAEPAVLDRIEGTLLLTHNKPQEAEPALGRAVKRWDLVADPILHLRWSEALRLTGKKGKACEVAKRLFFEHPMLGRLGKALSACGEQGSIKSVVAKLRQKQKRALLRSRRKEGKPLPALELDTEMFKPERVALNEQGKVTVLVVFSTWCPHCNVELPRIASFVQQLKVLSDLRDKVRVVGVRTSLEREREPYDQWRARIQPNFPIWLDATMSLAYARLAKSLGVPATLPRTLVLDEQGVVRFMLDSGAYRDTRQDLIWAVRALVREMTH